MKFFGTVVLILLIIVAVGLVYLNRLHTPADTSLTTARKNRSLEHLLERTPKLTGQVPAGQEQYKGKYIRFSYPSDAFRYESTTSGRILESIHYGTIQSRATVSIQVVNAADIQRIEEFSAVTLRENQPEVYVKSAAALRGQDGLLYVKKGDINEMSAFFFINKKIYSVSVTGADLHEVEEIYKRLLASITSP